MKEEGFQEERVTQVRTQDMVNQHLHPKRRDLRWEEEMVKS